MTVRAIIGHQHRFAQLIQADTINAQRTHVASTSSKVDLPAPTVCHYDLVPTAGYVRST